MVAQERLTEAEQPLNEAIRLDGESAEGWYQRGLLYVAFGQFDGALSDFETAAKINRHHMNALLRIAAIHHENEDWDEAEASWRNVLNVEPDNRVARRRIQDAIDGQSKQKKAEVLTTSGAVEAIAEESVEEEEPAEDPIDDVSEAEESETASDEDVPDFEFGFGTL